ncbi:ABC transporter permease [Azospirillum sp. A26]|uniref:ABC transporter permease n=1 Tax=Azospirillum sp. A26 TaxID=3160607 RepID=UPI0036700DA0
MNGKVSIALGIYSLGMAVLFIIPIIVIVIISLSGDDYLTFPPSSLSMRWFVQVTSEAGWRNSLGLSVGVGFLSAVVTLLVSAMAAYSLTRGMLVPAKAILALLLLPMIVPGVVSAVGMYFVSMELRLVGNPLWLALCHSIICTPPVLLILLTTFGGIDVNLERAGYGLGCSRWGVLRRVTLPLALPGLVSGFFVAFLGSFDEFIVSSFLMGTAGETLPVKLFQSIVYEIRPSIAAVSTIIIGLACLMAVFERIIRRALSRA